MIGGNNLQDKNFITIALPKGKLFGLSAELLRKVGWTAEGLHEKSRKLIITNEAARLKFIITKTADVPTYVEYGAADIGIIGKDVILESGKVEDYAHTRVATKFPRIAESFFAAQGMQMEYIKLNGSIELAPIIGMSESIVDIVETGTTLRENNLEEIVTIMNATARLIANRVSYKLKFARINPLVNDLRAILN